MLKQICTYLLLAGISFAQTPSTLSEIDRQLLLEKLKEIQESSKSTVSSRYGGALSAFKAGAASDSAAHELFVKCVEKVRFQDEAKKNSDFRVWRRRHKDRVDSPGFRRARRHQLAWLALTLDIAANPKKRETAGPRAMAILKAILSDHDVLQGSQGILKESALNSVYANAYGVNGVHVENWPKEPLNIADVFERVIMPPLRNPESISQLKEAWKQRIEYEGGIREKWSAEGSIKGRRPEYEKWYFEGRLQLHWTMEQDLYSAGDQRAGALRMLEFLKKNLTHKLAPGWIEDFKVIIKGGNDEPEEAPEAPEEEE